MNVIEYMKSRRNIRRYKPDPITPSIIDSIISFASFFPSLKNKFPNYIAIKDS